tara:strand:- start:1957 stop:2193 length:237 start_codon:yes stop_codon:yes gene_type:complete
MNRSLLTQVLVGMLLLAGCSTKPSNDSQPALFDSKAAAEEAADDFNCTGAHQMGDKWMPCNTHENFPNHGGQMNHHNH